MDKFYNIDNEIDSLKPSLHDSGLSPCIVGPDTA